MGFKVEINQVIRTQEIPKNFTEGGEYIVEKDESRVFADSFPIWLVLKDWTPVAEIQVISQTKKPKKTTITYAVKHVYRDAEQKVIKEMFKRMFGWE